MRLFHRSKSTRKFSDYRAVADAVHTRCAQREAAPDEWIAHDDLRDSARSYAPEERLQVVSDEVQQFQRDCEGMPRTWEEDPPPKNPLLTWAILWLALMAIIGFLVFGAMAFVSTAFLG